MPFMAADRANLVVDVPAAGNPVRFTMKRPGSGLTIMRQAPPEPGNMVPGAISRTRLPKYLAKLA
jgi:hypothetical protein